MWSFANCRREGALKTGLLGRPCQRWGSASPRVLILQDVLLLAPRRSDKAQDAKRWRKRRRRCRGRCVLQAWPKLRRDGDLRNKGSSHRSCGHVNIHGSGIQHRLCRRKAGLRRKGLDRVQLSARNQVLPYAKGDRARSARRINLIFRSQRSTGARPKSFCNNEAVALEPPNLSLRQGFGANKFEPWAVLWVSDGIPMNGKFLDCKKTIRNL